MNENPPIPQTFEEYEKSYRGFLREVGEASPTLREMFHLKGSAPASIQVFRHTFSMDGDFSTDEAFDSESVNKVKDELMEGLGDRLDIYQEDEDYGLFSGGLRCQDGSYVDLQLMTSIEDMPSKMLSRKGEIEGFHCQDIGGWLNDKLTSCLPYRKEAKDLYHIAVAASLSPEVDDYVQETMERISLDSDTCMALQQNLEDNKISLEYPSAGMLELSSDREGKNNLSLEKVIAYNQKIQMTIEPNVEALKSYSDLNVDPELAAMEQ